MTPGFDTTLISPSGQIVGTVGQARPASRRSTASTSIRPSATTRAPTPTSRSTRRSARSPSTRPPATGSTAACSRRCTARSRWQALPQRQADSPRRRAARLRRRARRLEDLPAQVQPGPRGRPDRPLPGHRRAPGAGPPGHRPEEEVRKHLVSALLLGGNVTVARGQDVGRRLQAHPRPARKAKQSGCVIAFSTFDAPVPSDSLFGRPGGGLDASGSDHRRRPLHEPGGARAAARRCSPRSSRRSRSRPARRIGIATGAVGAAHAGSGSTTPWYEAQAYNGACDAANDAHVLQISPVGGAPRRCTPSPTRPGACTWSTPTSRSATSPTTSPARPSLWLKTNTKPKKKRLACGSSGSRG